MQWTKTCRRFVPGAYGPAIYMPGAYRTNYNNDYRAPSMANWVIFIQRFKARKGSVHLS